MKTADQTAGFNVKRGARIGSIVCEASINPRETYFNSCPSPSPLVGRVCSIETAPLLELSAATKFRVSEPSQPI